LKGEEGATAVQPRLVHLERRLRQVALVAALAVIAYLGLAVLSDAATIRDGLHRLGPGQWLALLGLSLLNYALRFLRWHGYLLALGARVGIGRDLLIYVAGFAFTVTPGKAGEAVRSLYLRSAGVPWSPGRCGAGWVSSTGSATSVPSSSSAARRSGRCAPTRHRWSSSAPSRSSIRWPPRCRPSAPRRP